MFLYTFNSVPRQVEAELLGERWVKIEGQEQVPFEDFGDCLLCEDDMPLEVALAVWSSYFER